MRFMILFKKMAKFPNKGGAIHWFQMLSNQNLDSFPLLCIPLLYIIPPPRQSFFHPCSTVCFRQDPPLKQTNPL